MFYPLALFLQAAAPVLPSIPSEIPSTLIPGGAAAAILYFWRQDRKDRAEEAEKNERNREAEQARHEKRYDDLAEGWKSIVQDNTAAMTKINDSVAVLIRITESLRDKDNK